MVQPYTTMTPPLDAATASNMATTAGSSLSGLEDSWSRYPSALPVAAMKEFASYLASTAKRLA